MKSKSFFLNKKKIILFLNVMNLHNFFFILSQKSGFSQQKNSELLPRIALSQDSVSESGSQNSQFTANECRVQIDHISKTKKSSCTTKSVPEHCASFGMIFFLQKSGPKINRLHVRGGGEGLLAVNQDRVGMSINPTLIPSLTERWPQDQCFE